MAHHTNNHTGRIHPGLRNWACSVVMAAMGQLPGSVDYNPEKGEIDLDLLRQFLHDATSKPSNPQQQMQAISERERGNAAYKAGEFTRAFGHYYVASTLDAQNATLPFLNLTQTAIRLNDYKTAEEYASFALSFDETLVKGWYRRSVARRHIYEQEKDQDDLHLAIMDLQRALCLSSSPEILAEQVIQDNLVEMLANQKERDIEALRLAEAEKFATERKTRMKRKAPWTAESQLH